MALHLYRYSWPTYAMKTNLPSTYKNEFSDTQADNFCSLFWV